MIDENLVVFIISNVVHKWLDTKWGLFQIELQLHTYYSCRCTCV